MVRYICDQGHKFSHTAKQVIHTQNTSIMSIMVPSPDFVETPCCPICQSKIFDEYTEPVIVADVLEDMQLVEFKDVVAFTAKGYVELDRKDHVFAKGIVMLKTKPKIVEQPDQDCAEAAKDNSPEATKDCKEAIEKVAVITNDIAGNSWNPKETL